MPEAYEWKFAIYSVQKSRDGMELEWNLCNMRDISGQIDIIREYLLKKPVASKQVMQYSPFISDKEFIGVLDKSDELLHEQLSDIILNIRNGQTYPPSSFISGSMLKITGYAFYGECGAESSDKFSEPVLFMRRANPFLSGARLYTGLGNEIAPNESPTLKFSAAVDFLAIDGKRYFFSSSIEKDFAFENRHFAIAQKHIEKLVAVEIVGNFERFEKVVMTAKNARKFIDFNQDVLDYIIRLPIVERGEFLDKYGVNLDASGKMDTYDPEQCELIIDLLCCRSCLDPLGRLSVGNNITPR